MNPTGSITIAPNELALSRITLQLDVIEPFGGGPDPSQFEIRS